MNSFSECRLLNYFNNLYRVNYSSNLVLLIYKFRKYTPTIRHIYEFGTVQSDWFKLYLFSKPIFKNMR